MEIQGKREEELLVLADLFELSVLNARKKRIPGGRMPEKPRYWFVKHAMHGTWDEVFLALQGVLHLVATNELIVRQVKVINDLRGFPGNNWLESYPRDTVFPEWWLDAQNPPEGW